MAAKPRYPTGVHPLLADETARRRRIEARFVDAFSAADFDEVVLPIIDYVEPYASLVDTAAAKQSYRFVDREGDLVAIRADFTPMLARALAPSIADGDLPLRLFYRGDVIRVEASRLGANRELFQIGAEIVGNDSVDADVAMLRLASSLVASPSIVYNDTSIASALIAQSDAVRDAVAAKRMTAGVPAALRTIVGKLISGEATIDDVAPFAPEAAARLCAIGDALGAGGVFALHLDDIDGSSGYYTGLRFRVYSGGTKVAQGGRYDTLYERFGRRAAAIGFTFTIDDLD
ncbi:MAG TPA: ATP phosphoribosyltransferase regulatory subunit [Thermoanaerobaculia bacterium]|jgi:ATP phosphoribosyltransferase regulatory subunit|nr:ATP phosphoribosyltransferase regulatory subunit [Thermoanaerobaculia bacterium]